MSARTHEVSRRTTWHHERSSELETPSPHAARKHLKHAPLHVSNHPDDTPSLQSTPRGMLPIFRASPASRSPWAHIVRRSLSCSARDGLTTAAQEPGAAALTIVLLCTFSAAAAFSVAPDKATAFVASVSIMALAGVQGLICQRSRARGGTTPLLTLQLLISFVALTAVLHVLLQALSVSGLHCLVAKLAAREAATTSMLRTVAGSTHLHFVEHRLHELEELVLSVQDSTLEAAQQRQQLALLQHDDALAVSNRLAALTADAAALHAYSVADARAAPSSRWSEGDQAVLDARLAAALGALKRLREEKMRPLDAKSWTVDDYESIVANLTAACQLESPSMPPHHALLELLAMHQEDARTASPALHRLASNVYDQIGDHLASSSSNNSRAAAQTQREVFSARAGVVHNSRRTQLDDYVQAHEKLPVECRRQQAWLWTAVLAFLCVASLLAAAFTALLPLLTRVVGLTL